MNHPVYTTTPMAPRASFPPPLAPRAVGYMPTYEATPAQVAWGVASTVSAAACVYHGYKRNNSVGWALVWGFFGAIAPVITPVIAIAEGFGEPRRDK